MTPLSGPDIMALMNQMPSLSTVPTLPHSTLTQSSVPSISLFAQLLASERLTVQVNPGIQTAAFSPEDRILMLPSWKGFDEAAWLLFVSHEVGHALFTPADSLYHPALRALFAQYGQDVTMRVTNCFEDIRVERLVRLKYRGLTGTFSRGYFSLMGRDFFGYGPVLTDEVWLNYGPLDRINLYAKVGALLNRTLVLTNEVNWYNRGLKCETFDDVLVLVADVIATLSKEQKQNQQNQQNQQSQPGQQGQQDQQDQQSQPGQQGQQDQQQQQQEQGEGQDGDNNDEQEQGDGQEQDAQSQPGQQQDQNQSQEQSGSPTTAGHGQQGPPDTKDLLESRTAAHAEEQLKQAAYAGTTGPTVIFPTNTNYLHTNDVSLEQMLEKWDATPGERAQLRTTAQSYRREAGTILASMISAFRANQAAYCQRRAVISRSGMLDPNKLVAYKLTEDLFLRRREIPEAQNHGFVIHIDWSGSMDSNMATVLWQTLHLVWFAEAIKVPVSVYAFSNSGKDTPNAITAEQTLRQTHTYGNYPNGRLIELYRSHAPAQTKQDALAFVFALILRWSNIADAQNFVQRGHTLVQWFSDRNNVPSSLHRAVTEYATWTEERVRAAFVYHDYVGLGGTPLYHALMASVDTVRKFRQTYGIEQCISVWLTDGGDTDRVPMNDPTLAPKGEYGRGSHSIDSGAIIIDPRSGRTIKVKEDLVLAAMFEYHRGLTGATVVCIDITQYPLASYRRVANRTQCAVIANQVGTQEDEVTSFYSRRRRRARRNGINNIKVKKLVQSRRNVVMPTGTGTFDTTGIMLVTRKQQPGIGADAFLVSHPDWWKDEPTDAMKREIAKRVRETCNITETEPDFFDDDDDDTSSDTRSAEERALDESMYRPARLKIALTAQQHTLAMRRFADMLVPYLAAGRDDAR